MTVVSYLHVSSLTGPQRFRHPLTLDGTAGQNFTDFSTVMPESAPQSRLAEGSYAGPSVFATTVAGTEEARSGRSPSILIDSVGGEETVQQSEKQREYHDQYYDEYERGRSRRVDRDVSRRRSRRHRSPSPNSELLRRRRGSFRELERAQGVKTFEARRADKFGDGARSAPRYPGIPNYVRKGRGKFCYDPLTGEARPGSLWRHRYPKPTRVKGAIYMNEVLANRSRALGEKQVNTFFDKVRSRMNLPQNVPAPTNDELFTLLMKKYVDRHIDYYESRIDKLWEEYKRSEQDPEYNPESQTIDVRTATEGLPETHTEAMSKAETENCDEDDEDKEIKNALEERLARRTFG